MVHHRECLPLVVKAGEHLGGVHPEFHHLEGHAPANGFTLFGEIHGAHTSFAQRLDDPIAAEVRIPRHGSGGADGLSPEVVDTDTPKCALDQALRTQSRGIVGPQFRSATRAVWHVGRNSHLMPLPRARNLQPLDSLFMPGEPD